MKKLIIGVLIMGFHYCALAQPSTETVINSSGGSFEKNNISYEWSVGELSLVNHMQSSDGSYTLTNGYLQPMYNVRKRDRTTAEFAAGEIIIIQNPVKDRIIIHFRMAAEGKFKIVLFNESGKAVHREILSFAGGEAYESIPVSQLSNGTYILNVGFVPLKQSPSRKTNSYKIVKAS